MFRKGSAVGGIARVPMYFVLFLPTSFYPFQPLSRTRLRKLPYRVEQARYRLQGLVR